MFELYRYRRQILLADLGLLIESKITAVPVVEPEGREFLVEKLLQRSEGSFLWTILILQKLVHCYSKKDVERVIEDVPKSMEPLYKRNLDSMSKLGIQRKRSHQSHSDM